MKIQEISQSLKKESCPQGLKKELLKIPALEKERNMEPELGVMLPSFLVLSLILLFGLLFTDLPFPKGQKHLTGQNNEMILATNNQSNPEITVDYQAQARDLKLVLGYMGKALIEESSRSGQIIIQKTSLPIKKSMESTKGIISSRLKI